jgi:hypothetical protein
MRRCRVVAWLRRAHAQMEQQNAALDSALVEGGALAARVAAKRQADEQLRLQPLLRFTAGFEADAQKLLGIAEASLNVSCTCTQWTTQGPCMHVYLHIHTHAGVQAAWYASRTAALFLCMHAP